MTLHMQGLPLQMRPVFQAQEAIQAQKLMTLHKQEFLAWMHTYIHTYMHAYDLAYARVTPAYEAQSRESI